MESDTELIRNLTRYYAKEKLRDDMPPDLDNITQISIKLEKTTNYGRVDLFVEAKGAKKDITITIENKTKTGEHNVANEQKQTEEYADYVLKNHQGKFNVFFYLTPEWNLSEPSSDLFLKITYPELLKLMSETHDPIIQDFEKHIIMFFRKENIMFSEDDYFLMEKYLEAKSIISKFESDISKLKMVIADEITEKIGEKLGETITEWTESSKKNKYYYQKEKWDGKMGLGSYRLYKPEWFDENKFYFFVELCFENGLMQNINYQLTVKLYGTKAKNTLKDFLDQSSIVFSSHPYYVFCQEKSTVKVDSSSGTWREDLVSEAVEKLPLLIKRMDCIYQDFLNYRISTNKD